MSISRRILIYSPPEAQGLYDLSPLETEGYDVSAVSQPQALESWLNTFTEDAVLLIVHSSAGEGMTHSEVIRKAHPNLPIILLSRDCNESILKRALMAGLIDCMTIPVEPTALIQSIQRGFSREHSWQEVNQLDRICSSLSAGIIAADLTGHLLLVNPAAALIFSLTEEPYEGKLLGDVIHHPDLLDLLAAHGTFPKRSEITLDDGRVYAAQASLVPNIGTAAVLQEITYLKELDRIKSDFVNTVSHDLRSPLTAIYGFVGLIDRVGPVTEQQAEFIRHIQTSVQHITLLINDLLELGRVEADYDVLMEDVDLNEIVRRSIESLDYQLNEKMQELSLALPEKVPLILGNPSHLQRMVSNLVENSIKFTPPLGKIKIRCRADASQLILEIADSGHGIPLDEQPLVFDKFYRASNLSASTTGTGLGLSIVKTIVEKHHGRIWLESSPMGTVFSILLPVK